MPAQERSPWVYVGCGCAVVVVLTLAAIAAVFWKGYREVTAFKAGLEDPASRTAKVRELLPHRELPAGYHALGGLSIPLVGDVAFLSDRPPTEGGGIEFDIEERGFVYLRLRRQRDNEEELRRFLEGRGPSPRWMGQARVEVDPAEVLRRGTVEVGGQKLLFTAFRGESSSDGRPAHGIATVLFADCPDDDRLRIGLWFARDPASAAPASTETLDVAEAPAAEGAEGLAAEANPPELDLAGTPADPDAIRDFAGHFTFCPAS